MQINVSRGNKIGLSRCGYSNWFTAISSGFLLVSAPDLRQNFPYTPALIASFVEGARYILRSSKWGGKFWGQSKGTG
jgi:hypothetical protein